MTRIERKRRQLKATAYHEAGHAVVAFESRVPIKSISIIPDDKSLGRVALGGEPPPTGGSVYDRRAERWIEFHVMFCLAGVAAEKRFTGRHNWGGAKSDTGDVADWALHLHGGNARLAQKYIAYKLELAKAKVERPHIWVQIEALAEALLEHRTLNSRRARKICRDAVREWMGFGPGLVAAMERATSG